VLLVEVKLAANWICPPEVTFAVVGDRLIRTAGVFTEELWEPDATAHRLKRMTALVRMTSVNS
jgi:hypothetical protein